MAPCQLNDVALPPRFLRRRKRPPAVPADCDAPARLRRGFGSVGARRRFHFAHPKSAARISTICSRCSRANCPLARRSRAVIERSADCPVRSGGIEPMSDTPHLPKRPIASRETAAQEKAKPSADPTTIAVRIRGSAKDRQLLRNMSSMAQIVSNDLTVPKYFMVRSLVGTCRMARPLRGVKEGQRSDLAPRTVDCDW